MSIYSSNANIQTTRDDYSRGRALPGQRPAGSIYTQRPITGVDSTANVAQVTTVEITASANLDTPAIVIDGASYPFVSSTTDALTAAALAAALTAELDEGDLLAEVVASAEDAAEVVTITFLDYRAHTVSFTAQGSTTATVAEDTAASAEVNHRGGNFVALGTASGDPTYRNVQVPQSVASVILGVVAASPLPTHTIPPNPYGLASGESWPSGEPFPIERDGEICVNIAAAVSEGDDVYVICDPLSADNGKATNTDGGAAAVSQVTRGDVEFNGTDAVGLIVDGLTISVASNTSDDQTAADLRDAWNADNFAASVATATIDTSGTESYIILTFLDDQVHIVQAYSPATADVTSITNTTSAVEAGSSPNAVRFGTARFTEARTLAQGTAYVELSR